MSLSTQSIRRRVQEGSIVIEPFHERTVVNGLSFGLGSAGYDIRLGCDLWLFPFIGRLGVAIEYLEVPNDIRLRFENKSTWARKFVASAQGTNGEPGWRGYLTLEITRGMYLENGWRNFIPMKLTAGTPIMSIVFEPLDEPTEQPYGSGKYQDQPSRPVAAIMEPCK